jgi:hypothetical protein
LKRTGTLERTCTLQRTAACKRTSTGESTVPGARATWTRGIIWRRATYLKRATTLQRTADVVRTIALERAAPGESAAETTGTLSILLTSALLIAPDPSIGRIAWDILLTITRLTLLGATNQSVGRTTLPVLPTVALLLVAAGQSVGRAPLSVLLLLLTAQCRPGTGQRARGTAPLSWLGLFAAQSATVRLTAGERIRLALRERGTNVQYRCRSDQTLRPKCNFIHKLHLVPAHGAHSEMANLQI